MREKKYEPFDIEKAKAGAKVMMRNGIGVEILKFDGRGDYPLIGYCKRENEDVPDNWCENGSCYTTGVESDEDLVMCPEDEEYADVDVIKQALQSIADLAERCRHDVLADRVNLINTIKVKAKDAIEFIDMCYHRNSVKLSKDEIKAVKTAEKEFNGLASINTGEAESRYRQLAYSMASIINKVDQ